MRNGARYLRTTLSSLLAQDLSDIEILISDNCSDDDTAAIAREVAAGDQRVQYERLGSPVPMADNFFAVLARARGAYFMWAGDHDMWSTNLLSACIGALDANTDAILACPRAHWIDAQGKYLEEIPLPVDTRGLTRVTRVMAVVWTLGNCYPFYGVFRTAALRESIGRGGRRYPIGIDAAVLSDAAVLGSFVTVPDALFEMRRLEDYGDAAAQLAKLGLRPPGSRLRSVYRLTRFALARGRSAARLCRGPAQAAVVFVSVVFGSLYRYRWLTNVY